MGEYAKLRVTMFGDFVMNYQGTQLRLERTNTTKAMQALQMLLYYGESGVPRNMFMDALYSQDESVSDPANNLKVTVSNLRRLLVKAGLVGTTIRFAGGNYYWQSELEVQLDIRDFSLEVKRAKVAKNKKEQLEHLTSACELYTGDFLPHLQTEDWSMAAAARYREEFFACVRQLAALYKEREDYPHMLQIATHAAALYPLEEWWALRIESLLGMERYQEAKAVYEESVNSLAEEYDVRPSKRLLECLRRIDKATENKNVTLDQLQAMLQEAALPNGAYYCPLPGFIDAYRVASRMLERSGQSAYLMLCWMVDGKGQRLTDKEKAAWAAPKISSAIRSALRRGDSYTQPGRDRFLVLLIGTNQENCSLISSRIEAHYKKDPARGVQLRFKLAPVRDVNSEEMFQNKPSWK